MEFYPSRLCCETHWCLEAEEKYLASLTLFDWQGLYDRKHVGNFAWSLQREFGNRRRRDLEIESDMLSQYDAYMFYFSRSCSCSFGFVCHRLGQLQEARQTERFRIQERQRSIGYGCKEYDHSVQRRHGSFEHIPLLLASLPGACRCGAERCGRQATPAHAAEALAAKLRHPD